MTLEHSLQTKRQMKWFGKIPITVAKQLTHIVGIFLSLDILVMTVVYFLQFAERGRERGSSHHKWKTETGTSLVVQWLRLHVSNTRDKGGFNPWLGN